MKINIFLALLFAIVTHSSVLHAVDHITHADENLQCSIIHINNLTAPDIEFKPLLPVLSLSNEIIACCIHQTIYFKQQDNHSRAPPLLS